MSRGLSLCLVLVAGSVAVAGHKQSSSFVGTLSFGGWQLYQSDERLFLARSESKAKERGGRPCGTWDVSAPTIVWSEGKRRLVADTSGESPRFVLTDRPATGPDWTFEMIASWSPRTRGGEPQAGTSSRDFRVQVAEGPYRGWYLAADELPLEQTLAAHNQPIFRDLKLVKDRNSALVLTYVDQEYRVSR